MSDSLTGTREPFTYRTKPTIRLTPAFRARILELHRAGNGLSEISQIVDLDWRAVRQVIREGD